MKSLNEYSLITLTYATNALFNMHYSSNIRPISLDWLSLVRQEAKLSLG